MRDFLSGMSFRRSFRWLQPELLWRFREESTQTATQFKRRDAGPTFPTLNSLFAHTQLISEMTLSPVSLKTRLSQALISVRWSVHNQLPEYLVPKPLRQTGEINTKK